MKAKWGEAIEEDPYYNPNLVAVTTSFPARFPSARTEARGSGT